MRFLLAFLILAVASAMSFVHPVARQMMEPSISIHPTGETRWRPPAAWNDEGKASNSDHVRLYFAIKQQNLAELERTLLEISDPSSPGYSNHFSRDEVDQMVAPEFHAVETVKNWLKENGLTVSDATNNNDMLVVDTTVQKAEALLDTEYHYFTQEKKAKVTVGHKTQLVGTGKMHKLLRCSRPYAVPVHVAQHLDFVGNCMHFPTLRPTILRQPQSGDLFVEPHFLHALYAVPETVKSENPKNTQAVASFLEQYWAPNDLNEFFQLYWNTSVGQTVAQVGTNDPTNPGTEAELDVQYITAMGNKVPTTVYYTSGRAPNPNNEPFLDWLLGLAKQTTIPLVFSVSYGEDEKSVGLEYGSRVNVEFQKVGLRGTSILVAAGDSGAGGNCTSSGRFSPDFPSGSPWVTAVGGLVGGVAGAQPTGETVDSISGGGFSDYWPRPSYQTNAVNTYVATAQGLPPQANWNATGRGYPDLAAQSEMYIVVQSGIPLPGVGGTSCACPTTAGVISLLNDARLQKGKRPLGFLNPLIYSLGGNQYKGGAFAFNDAVSGSNAGCSFDSAFPAVKGWDASSGWGSVSYNALLPLVLALP